MLCAGNGDRMDREQMKRWVISITVLFLTMLPFILVVRAVVTMKLRLWLLILSILCGSDSPIPFLRSKG